VSPDEELQEFTINSSMNPGFSFVMPVNGNNRRMYTGNLALAESHYSPGKISSMGQHSNLEKAKSNFNIGV
jgi:hypothetical protein